MKKKDPEWFANYVCTFLVGFAIGFWFRMFFI